MSEIYQEDRYNGSYSEHPELNLYQKLLFEALDFGAKTKSLVNIPEICRRQGNSYGLARYAEAKDLIVVTSTRFSKETFLSLQSYSGTIYSIDEIVPGVDLSKGFIIDDSVNTKKIEPFKYALITGLRYTRNTLIKF